MKVKTSARNGHVDRIQTDSVVFFTCNLVTQINLLVTIITSLQMQSIQSIESKALIKFKYVEYKRQIEQILADIFISNEIIPRHTVEETKRLFGEAFQQHDIGWQ